MDDTFNDSFFDDLPQRLRLRETTDGGFPTILLQPAQTYLNHIILGDRAGAHWGHPTRMPHELLGSRVTHVLQHDDIEVVHCVVTWRSGLQPKAHNATAMFQGFQQRETPRTASTSAKPKIQASVYVSGRLVDGSQELRVGDILSFGGVGTPSFLVEDATNSLRAADGSPATFRILDLVSPLVLEAVLPHLSLCDLAAFALSPDQLISIRVSGARPSRSKGWKKLPCSTSGSLNMANMS